MKKSEDDMLLADPGTLVGDALIGWMERARAAEAEAASLKREMEEKDAHTRKQWSVAQFPVADYIDAESAVSVDGSEGSGPPRSAGKEPENDMLLAAPPSGGSAVPVRAGDWMQTYTGVQFWPLDPRPEEIEIEDIAHSLANQCRYAGHVTEFYSVAQHSVLVSRIVPREHALWGLLHDATEAYLVDLPRPVKRYSRLGDEYRDIEARLMRAMCVRFDLHFDEPGCVKHADDVLLMTEKRDLMPNSPAKWRETAEPLPDVIEPWPPSRAKAAFLVAFGELVAPSKGPARGPDGTRASDSSEPSA